MASQEIPTVGRCRALMDAREGVILEMQAIRQDRAVIKHGCGNEKRGVCGVQRHVRSLHDPKDNPVDNHGQGKSTGSLKIFEEKAKAA